MHLVDVLNFSHLKAVALEVLVELAHFLRSLQPLTILHLMLDHRLIRITLNQRVQILFQVLVFHFLVLLLLLEVLVPEFTPAVRINLLVDLVAQDIAVLVTDFVVELLCKLLLLSFVFFAISNFLLDLLCLISVASEPVHLRPR